MHRNAMRGWVVPVTMLGVAWVKWTVGLGGYSGYQSPPMYGDFEAQRHWLEITTHLPIRQWYTYDLPYWGLDYPPVTAYHSWICGMIGSWIDPSWFALDSSRGIETPNSKVYMRSTVFASDLLVYFPAVFLFVRRFLQHRSGRTKHVALLTLLLQPALILIDSGHFQYNSVMLGFTLLCLDYLAISSDVIGSVFFVLSLGFKQMALYYAPAIGSYLFGKCIFLGPQDGRKLFVRLAFTTLLTFVLIFLPWLTPTAIMDPISRIFPFNRGLFEDKVANFWCASDVVLKWRRWLGPASLVRLSAVLTAAGFSPAVMGLIYGAWSIAQKARDSGGLKDNKTPAPTSSPTFALLPYALLTSSLSFFLFSFQVHEKSILLPLLPATLILSGAESGGGGEDWEWGVLFNNVAVFSMWPLLKKDGQAIQYVALTVLWNRAIGYNPFALKSGLIIKALSLAAYTGIFALHATEAIIKPPTRYPDLFPVLNVLISALVFFLTWLWSIKRGVEVGWALGGLPSTKGAKDGEKTEQTGKVESSSVRKRSVRPSSSGRGRDNT
ncbi:glucosyltransferase [Hysterangium stoloniferum]|nr:glucosyltransferase [Hysterangium stoloniferum]